MLTTLSETILAKDCNVNYTHAINEKNHTDSSIDPNPFSLLETPFKDNSLTPLPNTPRFAIPLTSQSAHETPMPKIFSSTASVMSLVKVITTIITIINSLIGIFSRNQYFLIKF